MTARVWTARPVAGPPTALALACGMAWALGAVAPVRAEAAPAAPAQGVVAPGRPPSGEVIAEIRVHGNVAVPDDEVLRVAGIAVGDRLEAGTLAAVEARLRASGRFDVVEVRTRYRSLDMTAVALVLLVHEPPVPAATPAVVRPLRRLARQSMILPILGYEEGYGLTYGARLSVVDWLGAGERLSVPLTWGGEKQAAIEVERAFRTGPIARLLARGGVSKRRNPHYRIDDRRVELVVRAEQVIAQPLRVGVEAARADVAFGALEQGQGTFGVDATLDTRHDPAFPGNAVFTRVGWTSLRVDGAEASINRVRVDARGYLRWAGQSVLAVRAAYDGADRALPPYERALLGGASTLRGHRAGEAAGDRRAVASVELRLPLDSPVGAGKAGVVVFYDVGQVWNVGERLDRGRVRQGAGLGLFVVAPFIRLSVEGAANLSGPGGRLHLGFGVRF